MFTLSGSVKFSKRSGVRESFGGRMGIGRMYPLTLAELRSEAFHAPWVNTRTWRSMAPLLSYDAIEKWMERGGMPTFCRLTKGEDRALAVEGWLEALCYRDIQQLKGARYSGDIAHALLKRIARAPQLNVSAIAADLGVSNATITHHLSALEELLVIYPLHGLAKTGKTVGYLIFDPAVFNHLYGSGGDESFARRQSLKILIYNEIAAQFEYSAQGKPDICTYASRGGATIDFVIRDGNDLTAIDISLNDTPLPYALRAMKSFLKSHPNAEGIVLAPVASAYSEGERLWIEPWTKIG